MDSFVKFKESEWTYDASSSMGIGEGIFSASSGMIYLLDPAKRIHHFSYIGFGAGINFSIRLPMRIEIPLIPIIDRKLSGTGAGAYFPSAGTVYNLNPSNEKELSETDFKGGTIYLEGGIGALAGLGGSIMLLGVEPNLLTSPILEPTTWIIEMAQRASALLFMGGLVEGLILGGGVSLMLGHLH
jgi:hypothetical protein